MILAVELKLRWLKLGHLLFLVLLISMMHRKLRRGPLKIAKLEGFQICLLAYIWVPRITDTSVILPLAFDGIVWFFVIFLLHESTTQEGLLILGIQKNYVFVSSTRAWDDFLWGFFRSYFVCIPVLFVALAVKLPVRCLQTLFRGAFWFFPPPPYLFQKHMTYSAHENKRLVHL